MARVVFAGLALAGFGAGTASGQTGGAVVGKTYAQSREGQKPQIPSAKGAPNVIWILLDDVGFGASSAFGGQIQTPTFEYLANRGLRYTNFHTTGVCSPSRAALLTGRNHHNVGMGLLPQSLMAAEFPGYTGRLQPKDGTIAEYLRQRGYGTYMVGKWHLVPGDEATDLGPFDRWPTGKGFDHWIGFMGGATDQYKPDLVEDIQQVKPDGRHLNTVLADKAIFYIDRQRKLAPDKPFFLYYSTGAAHSPVQVDREWIDKYKGSFDQGWDVYRERTFARQKQLGVIPANAKLPPRSMRVPAWNSLSADRRKVYARHMEAYAGFLEQTDFEIGRVVSHLKEAGQLDNTVIFLVIGDNGGDIGGGANGEVANHFPRQITEDDEAQVAEALRNYDKIGTGAAFSNYPMGWSQATNTPFRDWKTEANSEGGTRNPLIVFWPQGLTAKGEIRNQYSYLTDILPTTLELTGTAPPATVKGVEQSPLQGVSLTYSFTAPAAPSRHSTQYYYLFGTGAIYHDGWKASFGYRPDFVDLFWACPSPQSPPNLAGKQAWELYNQNDDPTETVDLARKYPAKLAQMQTLFAAQAEVNHVYPLINWSDLYPRFQRLWQSADPAGVAANRRCGDAKPGRQG
ncbi:arylsulfatase [Novosphingobium sp. B 225]|uniref:arylsulfatase n=1 Tax=Novosphingobium sp. B 225 TaxID=1961849 RepID=UPI00159554BB|nr:arylsulfatase [Novosphingobium sp. B 225]